MIKALRKRELSCLLRHLKAKGLLRLYLEELSELDRVTQDTFYHPEGDAWIHTLRCIEVAESEGYSFSLVLASMLHDVGKVLFIGKDNYHSHERESAKRVVKFFYRFPIDGRIVKKVKRLVRDHMKFHHPLSERTIGRLIREHPYLDELIRLTEIDLKGSCGYLETFIGNKRKVELLKRKATKPITLLNGYEIMSLFGIPQGKEVGFLKALVYDAQVKGLISSKEEAIEYLKRLLRKESQP